MLLPILTTKMVFYLIQLTAIISNQDDNKTLLLVLVEPYISLHNPQSEMELTERLLLFDELYCSPSDMGLVAHEMILQEANKYPILRQPAQSNTRSGATPQNASPTLHPELSDRSAFSF